MEILKGIFSFPAKCYRKIIKSSVRDYNKTLYLFDLIFTKVILELWGHLWRHTYSDDIKTLKRWSQIVEKFLIGTVSVYLI